MYDNIAQILADINARYPDNITREITESDVRFVTSNLSLFFNDRIIDFYKTAHTNDASYTVNVEVVNGENNITDGLVICDSISQNRSFIIPAGIRSGNKLLVFVKSTNGFNWVSNRDFQDISGVTNKLKEGGNLLVWVDNSQEPIIFYLGGGSVGTGTVLVDNNDPIESIDITNDYLNGLYPLSFQYPLNTLIRFTNLTDMEFNLGQSQRLDGMNWYTSLTSYKNQ
jgi:hypothetical protein